ncbi:MULTISPECIES: type I glyceraldehyde-3-phosphate dehydrogenase [Acinetobacter]|uniref:Glyceraldehyde-3-phosphate dehydrogenase n=1 Tax=Acinetobacter pollinis TaxID=2605270 RepID=A0ABU6DT93_9GAMM|nr:MULTISPECIES: type I glyceraldehyde-3-phosphate dehydrogenase [Acinetobacter]MBF7690357.1 type I glyceraldehyde-3-phosphate dehydrogenase [Acinetobacter pollinis]MBF7693205.1 type I glyceraldehyde-3-phosphate dehydrogenase [Acinetobacter pollinis]MBF7697906.1 type I glyceraldehyde-3-phosphate dehydrogenase [Acinetobacter pollinis]MBF7700806.1 type I glyceraldehyde-3-phosphate dehydrogenase [Acinetobacter pollinis]MEB5477071.1 type I glyceraldehyde-3-phosphate dehydrogenase [Acinetobacter po
MINVAINGFGRIGRSFVRALQAKQSEINVVAINDLGSVKQLAHLLKYDTAFGNFPEEVKVEENALYIGGKKIAVYQERDPENLPWKELNIDVVLESTGVFVSGPAASKHLKAGARKVVISAPASEVDLTIVQGVNNDLYDKEKHNIVSNASCTTNCLAPLAKVINDNFGIVDGFMTTIHAYTQDQNLQDSPHKDMRRARCAAQNIVPTSTGAAKAIGLVIPELKGKLDGGAVRVPVITGSMVDLTVNLKETVTIEQVKAAVKKAAENEMKGVLAYTEDEIVSSDIIKNPASSIFDAGLTNVIGDKFLKVTSWYDNEWGFSNRLIDTIEQVAVK